MGLRSKERRAYWEGHYREWESSGLTQGTYCASKGIKLGTFKWWLERLRGGTEPVLSKDAGDVSNLRMIPVVPDMAHQSKIVLQQGNGWQLHLSTAVCPTWLGSVLRGLA